MSESVLFAASLPEADQALWLSHLRPALAPHRVLSLMDAFDPEAIRVAIVANPPAGSLAGLPGLGLVQSLWAGVDKLLQDPTLPPQATLARMVDPAMNQAMAETALWAVLSLHRGFFTYARQQRQTLWRQLPQRRAEELSVAVLGLGQMGSAVASRLAQAGYRVTGWSRTPHGASSGQPLGVALAHGEAALTTVLAGHDILINLLPLTPQTRGLFNAQRLAQMRAGASLVNLARGAHVVLSDLIAALNSGHLHHAVLDVFETEPLPPESPVWAHPQITLLPHAAALTDPRSAAQIAARNVLAWLAGEPVMHRVERERGY